MGPLSTYNKLKNQENQQQGLPPGYYTGPQRSPGDVEVAKGFQYNIYKPQQKQTMPQVDTSDAINSLAGMLVTPAEREAQQRRLADNKRKMILWTGLFDGLRNLGNLYSVSKGARPQQYTDNPYRSIEQGYQQEMKNLDDVQRNRQAYAQQIYNLRRQADQDQIRREAHEAQMQWYKNRDEQNERKMDLAEFKAKTDADYKKATLDQKNAINEVRIRLLEGQISKTEADRQYKLIMMGNAQAGTRTTTTKADGTVTTVVKEPNRNTGKSGGGGNKYGKYKRTSSGGSSANKYDKYKTNK